MLIYTTKTVEVTDVRGFICDRCKQQFTEDDDPYEMQESYPIRLIGGYGSVFGDGVKIECDLCQRCLKELINEFYRVSEEFDFGARYR